MIGKFQEKISISLEAVVRSCPADKMFWKIKKRKPRKVSLQELRPATETYLEPSQKSKNEKF